MNYVHLLLGFVLLASVALGSAEVIAQQVPQAYLTADAQDAQATERAFDDFKAQYANELAEIDRGIKIRQAIKMGRLNELFSDLRLYRFSYNATIPVNCGALESIGQADTHVYLNFKNKGGKKCKPKVKVVLYNQFLEPMQVVEESWKWSSLKPGEQETTKEKLETLGQRIFYFSYTYSE